MQYKREKDDIKKASLKQQLDDHYLDVRAARHEYFLTKQKAIANKNDMSLAVDASGQDSMIYSPYFKENLASGEPLNYECLKTKNTFAKIHGFGRIVFQSYPQIESQGANLTVEIILRFSNLFASLFNTPNFNCRSILHYMRYRRLNKIRNLYVQMDNYSINKNYTIICVMGALTLLGIIRKAKLAYLKRGNLRLPESGFCYYIIVGHSHNDDDADIGIAGNYLCNLELPDFEVFKKNLIDAFARNNQAHCDVQRLLGITDYVEMFGQGTKSFEGAILFCIERLI